MNPRERIIDTASRLFYSQGYNNTGINQLIKTAKVAKASFYEYFPSKEDLLIEYLKVTAMKTNEMLEKAIEKASTSREKVSAVFDHLIQRSRQTQYKGCNFLNIIAELPEDNKAVKTLVRSQKDHIRNLFVQILGRGPSAGESPLPRSRKDRLADELYLLFDSAFVTSKVYEDSWPIETAKRLAMQLV